MTQAGLDFTVAPPSNMLQRVARMLQEHQGEWVSALELMRIGGALSWRTRVSECRTILGLDIENETRNVGRVKHSYYRLKV